MSERISPQQTLVASAGRQLVDPERDFEVFCPDCHRGVSDTKGAHSAPEDVAVDRVFGWYCRRCDNVLPAHAVDVDASAMSEHIQAATVELRDGTQRLVPTPDGETDA